MVLLQASSTYKRPTRCKYLYVPWHALQHYFVHKKFVMSKLEAHVLKDHAPLQVCHPKIKGIRAIGLICHHGASKDIPSMDIGY
jgi:hypothetical protein